MTDSFKDSLPTSIVIENAYRHTRGPNDRIGVTLRWGHFSFYREQTSLLGTPQYGYALRTC